jgi:hypothetical protein
MYAPSQEDNQIELRFKLLAVKTIHDEGTIIFDYRHYSRLAFRTIRFRSWLSHQLILAFFPDEYKTIKIERRFKLLEIRFCGGIINTKETKGYLRSYYWPRV